MSCIVAMIMMRTIRRDLQRYEQLLVDGGAGAGRAGPCWAGKGGTGQGFGTAWIGGWLVPSRAAVGEASKRCWHLG